MSYNVLKKLVSNKR